ncbi:MAG TPA: hypothetical protein VJ810_09155 [Blastocatellia bacterium]|nr:hypothetical protein [Blastocatellia bacterium]
MIALTLIGINADQALAKDKARKGTKVRSIMSPQHVASGLSTGKRNNQTGATSFSSTSKERTMVSLGRENSIEMLVEKQAGNSAKVKSHAKRDLHLEDISLGVQVPRQTAVSNGSVNLQNSENVRSQAGRKKVAGTEAFSIDIGTSESIRSQTERSRRMKTYENVSDADIAAAIRARSRKRTRQ